MWTIPLRMRWAKSSQAFGGRGCFVELVVCGNIAKVLENIPGGRWGLAPLHVPFLLLFHRHHTTAPHPQCPISLTIRWWPHHLFHQEDSIWAPQVPASINVPASPKSTLLVLSVICGCALRRKETNNIPRWGQTRQCSASFQLVL